jgi:hypothetical protein
MSAGVQSQISVAKENTWGVAVTPTKSIAVRPTGGISDKENVQLIPAIKGQTQKYYDAIRGKVSYEGDYTLDLFADYVGYFLLSALGTDTPAVAPSETVVYNHAFTETLPKPSLTIEQAIGENTRRYAGAIVKGFKIEAKAGEMVEFTPSIMAKTQAGSTEIAGAFSTVKAFNFAQAVVKCGGVTLTEVQSLELNFVNGLEMVYALGSNEASFNSITGGSEVTGKIECYLDSITATRLANYLSGTKESFELILTGDTIGNVSTNKLDIVVPVAVYTAGDTKVTDAHNVLTVEFSGMYDPSTSKLIGVTLTNLVASY